MNNYKKINTTKSLKSHHQTPLADSKHRAKLMAYLKQNPRVQSEASEYNSVRDDSGENFDSYRFRVKLLERVRRPPKIDALPSKKTKTRSVPDENEGTKAEKLEILNNLLTKKNSLLEQNLAKLKQENKLLKRAAYLVLESKDLPTNEWKEQFEESVANITLESDIFPDIRQNAAKSKPPHRQSSRKQSMNTENQMRDSPQRDSARHHHHQERIFELEDQNKRLERKVQELEDILTNKNTPPPYQPKSNHRDHQTSKNRRSAAHDESYQKSEADEDIHANKNTIPYQHSKPNHRDHRTTKNRRSAGVHNESYQRSEVDDDLKTILDEAITKIKTMEYELESFEQKNDHLQSELRNQKKMTEFNERSYGKLQENQQKLLEENQKLQRGYQEVMKELDKIRRNGNMR